MVKFSIGQMKKSQIPQWLIFEKHLKNSENLFKVVAETKKYIFPRSSSKSRDVIWSAS